MSVTTVKQLNNRIAVGSFYLGFIFLISGLGYIYKPAAFIIVGVSLMFVGYRARGK